MKNDGSMKRQRKKEDKKRQRGKEDKKNEKNDICTLPPMIVPLIGSLLDSKTTKL